MISLNLTDKSEKIKKSLKEMKKPKDYLYIYSTTEIYWIGEWCKGIIKITESISNKLYDVGKEIFKMTGKLPDDTNNFATNIVYVYFTLNELKEIRNYASLYKYPSNSIPIKAETTLNLVNAKIDYLEKQKNKILDVLKSGCRESYQTTHEFHTYTKADMFWYAEWALDKCKTLYPELYKKLIKGFKLTEKSDEIYQYYFFKLHELQNIRHYTLGYYHALNHDQPDRKRSVEESIALCRLDEKIEFIKEWEDAKLKHYLEGEERMNNSTENQEEMKCETPYSKKAINQSWEALHKPDTSDLFPSINQLCDNITDAMWVNEDTLVNIARECIVNKYNIEYKFKGGVTIKGYITHGEVINYIENGITKLYITINIPDEHEDDGTLIINLLEEINLKTLAFKDNTLFLQHKNA